MGPALETMRLQNCDDLANAAGEEAELTGFSIAKKREAMPMAGHDMLAQAITPIAQQSIHLETLVDCYCP